ncbi:PMS1 protein homolog 1-like isoform X3 [Acropora muricata]|uniref:PMS1 protein homolog 1-like isoform X3 n=1 Tax=Acropora muricata TaxID=159855 RepID=UPI0034E3C977
MNLLPPSTVKLIASSQVITSVSSAVKELIENSLDAGAGSIEVKLDGWGLEKIEVRDNGSGIKLEDAPFIAQPHYTSKISSDNDLKVLQTYGFRGEALGSLSSLSNLSVLTKTESEQVGTLYIIGRTGKVEASQPKPAPTGTTVTATNLFKNLPVRKQFSSNSKKCKEELKKVEDLVMAYGLIHPSLRISLRHNKSLVWQKNKVSNHRTALLSVFGTALLAQLGVIESCDGEMNVIGYLPRPGSDIEITGRTVNDRCFVFLNGRPVNAKFIHQLVRQYYSLHSNSTPSASNRYPIAFLSIELPPESIDVNLEPNKSSVMLTNKEELSTLLTKLLDQFYSDAKNRIPESKSSCAGNINENGTGASKKSLPVNKKACHSDGLQVQSSKDASAEDGKCRGVEGTYHMPNGEHSVSPSSSFNCKHYRQGRSSKDGNDDCFDENGLFEKEQRDKHFERDRTCCLIDNTSFSNGDDSLVEGTSWKKPSNATSESKSVWSRNGFPRMDVVSCANRCHKDEALPLLSVQQDDSNTSLDAPSLVNNCSDSTAEQLSVGSRANETFSTTSAQQDEAYPSGKEDVSLVPSLSSTEFCRMSDETIHEIHDTGALRNTGVKNCEECHAIPVLSGKDKNGGSENECLEKHQNSNSMHIPSTNKEKTLFSLNLDDLLNDSDLDITFENSSNEMSLQSDPSRDQTKQMNRASPASNVSFVTENKSSTSTKGFSSENDWSMGRGIIDKQGNQVEPVTLLLPAPLCDNSPVTPLQRKRKHSSNQSRLSLSSKKIKKIPEITKQPLITKIMSPNPLQRKVLYKKTEVPFCLNALREVAKNRRKGQRSVDQNSTQDSLIGRLDPWGVWLMLKKGTDIVCANQYRIQEKLLFQRLMECHSLPKERIDRPITLSERYMFEITSNKTRLDTDETRNAHPTKLRFSCWTVDI